MLRLGASVSSLNFTLRHGIDFLRLLFIPGVLPYYWGREGERGGEGRWEGLDPDFASSLELKYVVSSPNKRKNLRSSGTIKGKNWAWFPGKRILLLSYEIQSKNLGYLSLGQASSLPLDVEGPTRVFIRLMTPAFHFHEPIAFKLLGGT